MSLEAQQTQRSLLDALLETAIDAIIVIDDRGVVKLANSATTRLFGYETDEVVGKNISQLMPSPHREHHDGYLQKYFRTGETKIIGMGREVPGRRKDGTLFPMHLSVSEMSVDGRRMFAGIVRDISDLKEAQQRLAEANQALEQRVEDRTQALRKTQADLVRTEKLATLGQVSGGIAHEIRNPLNAVKTSVYYLMHAPDLPAEKVSEHLERINRQVTMVDNVITALSDVARLPEPKLGPVDLRGIVTEALTDISSSNAIQINNAVPDGLPAVRADAHQVPIVFRNLFRNAVDAMPDGGELMIEVDRVDGEIIVSVSDTGVGIATEDLAKITEPMYSTKARGMGLGLAISKTIVEKNGGRLDAESQVGEGTTFRVRLKVHDTVKDEAVYVSSSSTTKTVG